MCCVRRLHCYAGDLRPLNKPLQLPDSRVAFHTARRTGRRGWRATGTGTRCRNPVVNLARWSNLVRGWPGSCAAPIADDFLPQIKARGRRAS
jgi:hypothetical protein